MVRTRIGWIGHEITRFLQEHLQFYNNKLWIANGSLNGNYSLKAIEINTYTEVYNQEFNLNITGTTNCHLYFGNNSMGIVSVSGKNIFLAEFILYLQV